MPLINQIKINLADDWERLLIAFLSAKGYKIPTYEDKLKLGMFYHNLNNMRISSIPRKVHISKEFNYPKKYKKRIIKLKKRFEKGEDVTPYLSSGVARIKNRDHLLYDWNIHHLHLGERKESKRFSERTNELLFVYSTEKAIYFLTVMDHKSFADKTLLSIVHNNWPDIIKRYLLKGATGLNRSFTDTEISTLRKSGVLTFLQLDSGEVYMSPGMGVVSTAESAKAVRSTQHILNHLNFVEREIENNPNKIKARILKYTGIKASDLYFELKIINGYFFLYESHSKYMEFVIHSKEYEEINNA